MLTKKLYRVEKKGEKSLRRSGKSSKKGKSGKSKKKSDIGRQFDFAVARSSHSRVIIETSEEDAVCPSH
jgi:hypothetical protein